MPLLLEAGERFFDAGMLEAGDELFDAGLQGFGWFGKPAWWVRPAEAVGRNTIPPLDMIGGKLGPVTDTAPKDEVATTSPLGTRGAEEEGKMATSAAHCCCCGTVGPSVR